MDVLLLHPFPWGLGPRAAGAAYPVMPVGMLAVANRLCEAGFQVRGLNLPVQHQQEPGFRLDAWCREHGPAALVLLDLHWYEHTAGVLAAAARIRDRWPACRIAVGGLTATLFAEELLALSPEVDAVVGGEAAETTVVLAREVATTGRIPRALPGLATRRHPRPARAAPLSGPAFDALDYVSVGFLEHAGAWRRSLYSHPRRPGGPAPLHSAAHWLGNGRGCLHDCAFCGGGAAVHRRVFGHRLRRRDPRRLARDTRRLADQGVDQVALCLDPDLLGDAHRDAFFRALRQAGLRPGLYVESFHLPSPALVEALERGADRDHTEVVLSPLSGHRAVRHRNGRHFDDEALLHAVDRLLDRDLSCSVFFSLNLPGENERTLDDTLALAERILARDRKGLLRVAHLCHTLDPASPMARDPHGHHIERLTLRTLEDYASYGRAPRPFSLQESERGFETGGRSLARMADRWDTWCRDHPGAALPVSRI